MTKILSKLSAKLIIIMIVISILCLGSSQPANSQLGALNPQKIALEISNAVQANLQTTIQKATEPYTNQANAYVQKIDDYQRQIEVYQQQLNTIPVTIEQQVDRSISGVTQQVQGEINNITQQVQGRIDGVQNQVTDTITRSLRMLIWGMVGINGLTTAVIAWLVMHQVMRPLRKQVLTLNQTIQSLQSQLEQQTVSLATPVPTQIDGVSEATLPPADPGNSPPV